MIDFLSRRLSSMRRIFAVMIAFGLAMGLVFPFVVSPFVTWHEDRKLFFQLACLVAGFLVGSFCYLLVKVTLFQRNRLLAEKKTELEAAKDRFACLTRGAIEAQNWSVSFYDERVPNCWEQMECNSLSCPAFGQDHVRCWLLAGTYCGGEVQGRFAQKLGDCTRCDVYQGSVGHNPINEIGENFNSLMLAVQEKEDQLQVANTELKDQYSELELLHKQAREMADTDLLTGLRNHAHFQHHLRWEVKRSQIQHQPLSLLMLDLDYFKSINDRYGHQKGDEVLRQVGKLLRRENGFGSYAARYGGEEFVLLLPETRGSQAMEAADALRQAMKELPSVVDLPESAVAASIGVADMPDCAADADSLLSAADTALLFAKRKGRDRVAYFRDLSDTELKIDDIDRLHSRLEGASLQTIRALAEAVDASDDYPVADGGDLSWLAQAMAADLGMEKEEAEALSLAARLHDIGKIGVPGSILRKTEKLSAEELSLVQQHPLIGQRIVEEARQLQDLISAILYHHERWDGKGYPERLQGNQIPLMARIVGIIDAYRAMRCDRPYRKALSIDQAIGELRAGSGSQFDPRLVELFIRFVEQGRDEGVLRQAG